MSTKHGVSHLTRLIRSLFEIIEDSNQTPELRADTAKTLLAALERREAPKRRKSASERAVERMIGPGPKKVTPFSRKD